VKKNEKINWLARFIMGRLNKGYSRAAYADYAEAIKAGSEYFSRRIVIKSFNLLFCILKTTIHYDYPETDRNV
jgi:hypothetical protein